MRISADFAHLGFCMCRKRTTGGIAVKEAARVTSHVDHYKDLGERELRVVLSVAAYQARSITRRLGLSATDRQDAEQDIVLALLRRRRFFDPTRAAWSTFVNAISDDAVRGVARSIRRRRHRQELPLELEEVSDSKADDGGEENVSRWAAVAGTGPSPEAVMLMALSVEQFVASLPSTHALVAELALAEDGDMGDAQRRSGLSTSEFYRRLHEVRMRLRCLDLVRPPRRPAHAPVARRDAA